MNAGMGAGRPRLGKLPKNAFDGVFKKGKRVSHPALVLIVLPNPPSAGSAASGPVRLGVIVGKSIVRDAVPRNRIRRILRESFRIESARTPPPPADCVLLARPGAKIFKTRSDADAVVRQLLSRI